MYYLMLLHGAWLTGAALAPVGALASMAQLCGPSLRPSTDPFPSSAPSFPH